jgi:phosphoglucosamine mutase
MVADGSGRILNGDAVLYLLALGMRAEGRLRDDRVVATVMSNLALEHALAARGIAMERTPVGDRWVADRMAETGAVLGGEQSGHIILADWAVTGDGLLTALAVLAEMQRSGRPASELAVDLTPYPQLLKNVKLGQIPPDWDERPEIKEAVRACAADLGADGRVFMRPSGTEPLLRIMLEGRDVDRIQSWADRLAAVVQEALESATEPLGQ